jgi:hypothetical protein
MFTVPSFDTVKQESSDTDEMLIPVPVNCIAFPSEVEKDLSSTAPLAGTEAAAAAPPGRMACTAILVVL